MAAQAILTMTSEEYLAFERASQTRHELINGVVYAMAGGSERHASIISNLSLSIGASVRPKGCRHYTSDMRVKVDESGAYTYPDFVLVCGKPVLEDSRGDSLLNPILIVEVLSPSTAAYDRGAKFAHYRLIESLRTYLVVEQESVFVDRYDRREDGVWTLTSYGKREEILELPSVGVAVPLAEVYRDIDVPDGPLGMPTA